MILHGKVIKGDGWGGKIGYPTANLDRRHFRAHPVPKGVWACRVRVRESIKSVKPMKPRKWLKGVAVIGVNDKIEVHVLDFEKNIYGWYGEIELVLKMRSLRNYATNAALVKQIRNDVARARRILL